MSRKAVSVLTGLLLVLGTSLVFALGSTSVAHADTAPPATTPATPATVSADALPTVQINGVVWAQVTVGNTVYATGSFTSARPAGSPSGTNETARGNLLAYDITTGNLVTSFNHSLNAQGRSIAVSPDHTRLYVGGDFTQVDGVAHKYLAAFNLSNGGSLIANMNPGPNDIVKAVTATNSTVYFGGSFTTVGGVAHVRLAAMSASSGALLSWSPSADDYPVSTMLVTPDGSEVLIGGQFTTVNHIASSGLAALDPVTGVNLPWAPVGVVKDGGPNSGITSITTDGTQVYVTGYVFTQDGTNDGYLEGSFAADPDSGTIHWLEDCHGDSYDTFATGKVLYLVSHEHYCGNIGGFPQTNPTTWYRATAFTNYPTGTVSTNTEGNYTNWAGQPAPTQLDWYPQLQLGTYTGQGQAAWSATGNSQYLALGGEFPSVNNTAQQGLVRFAIPSIAPDKIGPKPSSSLTPTITSQTSGTLKISWGSTFDIDNQALTYKIVRDSKTATPIYTVTTNSTFWNLPSMSFTDTGLTPGVNHSYRIYVYDPNGNVQSGSSVVAAAGTYVPSAYANDVVNQGASDYWRLGETSGTMASDWIGNLPLTEQAGVTHGAAGAINGDTDGASTFDGSSTDGMATSTSSVAGPQTFSEEIWFNTTTTSGGRLMGFGNQTSGLSNNYDRQIYMDNSGHIYFGVCGDSCPATVSTAGTYNDGQWHQVVGTFTSSGIVLYVDGRKIGTNTGVHSAYPLSAGYWRIGGDNTAGWPNQPSSNYFAGTLDEAAVFPAALTLAQVQQQYTDSGRTVAIPAKPSDSYGKAVYALNPDSYLRLDETTGTVAADTSPNGANATYGGGVTLGVTSPVSGTTGTAVTLDGGSGYIVGQQQVADPTVYSEDIWFKTTSTSGGLLTGFGDAASGESSNYDRHVIMLNTGQLQFGVYDGGGYIAQSPLAYNDGQWHNMVATQGPDGMTLYVDGRAVATNAHTVAQNYNGYWRVGGDHTWGGTSSDYFAGTVDEASFYNTAELTAAQVLSQYDASPAATNIPPTASFTATPTNLSVAFDGSGSSDPDGTVASYSWNFGDGSAAGTGVNPTHVYSSPGTYTVTLTVTDNSGATGTSSQSLTVRAPNAPAPTDAYGKAVYGLNPSLYWRLDETSGTTATDTSPNQANGTYQGGYTLGVTSPVSGSAGSAVTLDGSSGGISSQQAVNDPQVFTESAWFKTTTTSGGKIIGFGDAQSGLSNNYDRQVFMLNSGQLEYGAYANGIVAVTSPASYNDGQWHQLVATLGSGGMVLYVDGQQVGSNSNTVAQNFTGYWRVGGDNENAWPNQSSSNYFGGTVDEVAIFPTQLSSGQVQSLYQASPSVTVTAPNQPPVAAFTATSTNLSVAFDGTGSSDPDGTVSGYSWNFGDGSAAGSGATPSHTYSAAGTYSVTLTVTDNSGATTSVSHSVTVTAANQPPVAAFTATPTNLSVAFDGSGSSDPDGTVASYSWNYGDGSAAGTGAKPTYVYAAAGTYTVTLTVTDNQGATNTVSHTVTVAAANKPPVAAFTATPTNLSVAFDGSGSSDPDGTVASYSWNFGDGSPAGTGAKPTYAYAAAGTYTVTLTVTDNSGATNSVSHSVIVTAANQPPVAAFTATPTNLSVAFDGSGSSDPDGTVASYSWNYGDGSAVGSGSTTSHAYPAAGTYPVTLTVTDNSGATNSVSHSVTVTPPANAPAPTLASDAFNRTVTGGLGTADTGGAWKVVGTAANASVSGGNAMLAMPTATTQIGAYLPSVSSTDTDTTVTYTTDKAGTGGGVYLYVVGRRVGTNLEYRGRIRISGSTVYEALTELNSSASETVVKAETAVTGLTYTPGTMLDARLQVTGTSPTTLRLKVWAATGTEPSSWQLTTTDSASALQAAGSVGLTSYLSGSATNAPVTTKAANFAVHTTAAPPVAAFTASCTARTCSTDASTSTDPNNDIAGYTWSWGDGTVTTGQTSSHTFTAPGTYRITLTATDQTSRTSVATQTVTIS